MSDLEFQSYADFNQNAQWLQVYRLYLFFREGFHEMEVNIKSDLSLPGECRDILPGYTFHLWAKKEKYSELHEENSR